MGISVTQNRHDLTFTYDLTLDEARLRSAVLEAIGDDWDRSTRSPKKSWRGTCSIPVSTRTSSGSTTTW